MVNAAIKEKAIRAICQHGTLLVYPLKDKKEPPSIWSCLYPRSPMRWSWDEDADPRVSLVWYLKEELSRSKAVVYGKWYQNRATFFSFEAFACLRAVMRERPLRHRESRQMLELLEQDSPLSTKQVKSELGLQGRLLEKVFVRAQKELFERGDLVGFGEIEDSAFPSMGMAAAKVIFEELCHESAQMNPIKAEAQLKKIWGEKSPFCSYLDKIRRASS